MYPDDLRALIDAAHQRGLMMYLDVVYNHFGPEGNYMYGYAKLFNRRQNPRGATVFNWGATGRARCCAACLLKTPVTGCATTALTACAWMRSMLWIPAVQVDFLTDLALTVRATVAQQSAGGSPRHVHLMLENDFNQASPSPGLYNAQWNDDAHQVFHVTPTGECDGIMPTTTTQRRRHPAWPTWVDAWQKGLHTRASLPRFVRARLGAKLPRPCPRRRLLISCKTMTRLATGRLVIACLHWPVRRRP
ncbi:MAG: alpha-amylase family glycosyl hydrolase [Vampirovibrionales bacterium]